MFLNEKQNKNTNKAGELNLLSPFWYILSFKNIYFMSIISGILTYKELITTQYPFKTINKCTFIMTPHKTFWSLTPEQS